MAETAMLLPGNRDAPFQKSRITQAAGRAALPDQPRGKTGRLVRRLRAFSIPPAASGPPGSVKVATVRTAEGTPSGWILREPDVPELDGRPMPRSGRTSLLGIFVSSGKQTAAPRPGLFKLPKKCPPDRDFYLPPYTSWSIRCCTLARAAWAVSCSPVRYFWNSTTRISATWLQRSGSA